ncbi:MAG: ethylbenzene dehydrogenase-related protein [Acidimicrobiia bacterium]
MPRSSRNIWLRVLVCIFVASGVLTACGGGAAAVLEAPTVSISVDGDAADWEDVPSETIELEPVLRQDVLPHTATISVARDATNVYVLFEVSDNLTWTEGDVHKSGAAAVMWRIDDAAATHMGAEAESLGESQGMVDIWHWQLECPAGSTSGGAASATDNGDDPVCDLDDEWSATPSEREDDDGDGAENSLLGVWSHDGSSWIFEISRPLVTGDANDADLSEGGNLALAYWDGDNGDEGWGNLQHVVSSDAGWIEVRFAD